MTRDRTTLGSLGRLLAAALLLLSLAPGCLRSSPRSGSIACDSNDDCPPGQVCEPATGECFDPDAEPDQPKCVVAADCVEHDDGNLCNGLMGCASGKCVFDPSSVVHCSGGSACIESVCNPDSGRCEDQPRPSGWSCEADGDVCTIDTCNGAGECWSGPLADWCAIPCTSAADCPLSELQCMVPHCDDGTCGVMKSWFAPCDDGDPCTRDDACVEQGCLGIPLDCDDAEACTVDACEAGVCGHTFEPTAAGCTIPCDHVDDCPPPGPCHLWACQAGLCIQLYVGDPEVCDDGVDNDCNGDTDCDDAICAETGGCGGGTCGINPIPVECNKWTAVTGVFAAAGIDQYACDDTALPGNEVAFVYTPPKDMEVSLSVTGHGPSGEADMRVLVLYGSCTADACEQSHPLPDASGLSVQAYQDLAMFFVVDAPDSGAVFGADIWVGCPEPELCQDWFDNDQDGLFDCADPDCWNDDPCEKVETLCGDGIDNDGDGYIDCQDPTCQITYACGNEQECDDGLDNDDDGVADCADSDCDGVAGCEPYGEESCGDGFDNDADGHVDCGDGHCGDEPACFTDCPAAADAPWPTVECYEVLNVTAITSPQSAMPHFECFPGLMPGGEMIYRHTAAVDGEIRFDADINGPGKGGVHAFILEGSCNSGACVMWYPEGEPGQLSVSWMAEAGQDYWIVLDSTEPGWFMVESEWLTCY